MWGAIDNEKPRNASVSVADTLVDDFYVVDLLFNLVTRSVDLFGATAAALLLCDEAGILRVASASTKGPAVSFSRSSAMGPCLDASAAASLSSPHAWTPR